MLFSAQQVAPEYKHLIPILLLISIHADGLVFFSVVGFVCLFVWGGKGDGKGRDAFYI